MADQEADQGFTVVDRRRRGEEQPAAPRREPSPQSQAMPHPSHTEPLAPPPGEPRADLASFCAMLYTEALMHLGHVPNPVSGQAHQDLPQAQFTIDLLTMIKDKTEGNRTAEESAVLDEILATLRMGFVRASRRS